MRSRFTTAATAFVLITAAVAGASPSHAATGSPQAITVDCDLPNGVTATTITGNVGDTVVIDNTSGTGDGCTLTSTIGVITATNLTGGVLAAGATSTVTVVAAGIFTITPRANGGGGTATQITVTIGNPISQAEYDITFDANGGTCSSNPLVVTAASGDWYGLPTNGSGAYQCQRPNYRLIGWSHGSTLQQPGQAAQVPDLPLPQPGSSPAMAAAADHATLFAIWQPLGVEITYDANVGASDTCYRLDSWLNTDASQRTTTTMLYFANQRYGWDALASTAPCSPGTSVDQQLQLAGWALTGDGPIAYRPGQLLAATGFEPESSVTLYAVWSGLSPCEAPPAPGVNWSGCDLSGMNLTSANLAFANLAGANLTNASLNFAALNGAILIGANLNGSSLAGASLGEANLIGANLQNANVSYAGLNGANLQNANLNGANLMWSGLGSANLTNATIVGANFSGANLGEATWTDGSLCALQSVGSCQPWPAWIPRPPAVIPS